MNVNQGRTETKLHGIFNIVLGIVCIIIMEFQIHIAPYGFNGIIFEITTLLLFINMLISTKAAGKTGESKLQSIVYVLSILGTVLTFLLLITGLFMNVNDSVLNLVTNIFNALGKGILSFPLVIVFSGLIIFIQSFNSKIYLKNNVFKILMLLILILFSMSLIGGLVFSDRIVEIMRL